MDTKTAAAVLDAYMAADLPAFMWGAPGIGKSAVVKQCASRVPAWAAAIFLTLGLPVPTRLPLIDVRAILLDPVDLRGLPTVEGGKAAWAQPDFLPREDRDGPVGILFLDELNAAPASVQAACFQLILDRRLGEYVMPKGWRIVAAGNRQGDRAAAQRMPSALANRFAHIDVDADLSAWTVWATAANIPAHVVAFIRFRVELLHKMEGADLRAFPTPRSWEGVAKLAEVQTIGPKDPRADAFRQALVSGVVGEAAAAEFEGFVRVWRSLPTIADIIANPDQITIPDDPATRYAVATALARKADRKNFDAIMRFSGRALPQEFGILLCIDAITRDPALKTTRGFIDWAAANQDVVL
jgi:hypothetical protein